MRSIVLFSLSTVFAFVMSGCAVYVRMPVNRFDSPEAMGKKYRAKVAASSGGANYVILTPDQTVRAPDSDHPTFDSTDWQNLRLDGGIALTEDFDIELRNFSSLFVKYQFLGDGRLHAEPGNFAMAITGAIGGYSSTQESTGFLVGYSKARTELTELWADAALVGGYRFADWAMIYGGPFFTYSNFKGNWSGTDFSGVASAREIKGNALQTGVNLGLELGVPLVQGKIEAGYGNIKSADLNNGRFHVGVQVAFHIGRRGDKPAKSDN